MIPETPHIICDHLRLADLLRMEQHYSKSLRAETNDARRVRLRITLELTGWPAFRPVLVE